MIFVWDPMNERPSEAVHISVYMPAHVICNKTTVQPRVMIIIIIMVSIGIHKKVLHGLAYNESTYTANQY